MDALLVELRPEETHALRRSALRTGTPSDEVVFDADEVESTFHLGLCDDGEIVAISTWVERPYPDRAGDRGFQIRGMATVDARRGEGLGARLLQAGIDRCRAAGATVVWAWARDSALPFYVSHGFATVGAGYIDLTTGLPHHDVLREIR